MGKKSKRAKVLNMQRKPAKQPQATQAAAAGGGSTTYYVHGPRGIHAQQKDGQWSWMAQDGLGSVRSVLDNGVNVQETMTYDPFGNEIASTGMPQTPYGFTGEMTDPNQLVYLRERYYNPQTGTFISQDPFQGSPNDPMSLNRYAYAHGNPVNMTDPSGRIPISQVINNMMIADPLRFAIMMNTGCSFLQQDPCEGIQDSTVYAQCRFLHQGTVTPTPLPGTPYPSEDYYVRCDLVAQLNIRQKPSVLAPTVVVIENAAGMQIQTTNFIPGDTQLGGSGWRYANLLGGWVYDGVLVRGKSPCPSLPKFITPTPQTTPIPTSTPGTDDLDTISRVINCEANRLGVSAINIGHVILNRMTASSNAFGNYRTAIGIVQNTGVDCYTGLQYKAFDRSPESDSAAKWLLGLGTTPTTPTSSLIDLRAYFWLGVPSGATPDEIFNYVFRNPQLYNYAGQCNANEPEAVRRQRFKDRLVTVDPSDTDSTTAYFSLNPLCER